MEINEQQISDLISENERLKDINQRKGFKLLESSLCSLLLFESIKAMKMQFMNTSENTFQPLNFIKPKLMKWRQQSQQSMLKKWDAE